MEPQEILFSVGFNKKEAQVYLAALELGGATITDIAQKAGLPRTTSYGIIKILSQKGLVSFNVKKKRKYFFAEDPKRLLSIAQERGRILEEAMPNLQSIYNVSEVKPKVKFYEGKNGIKSILEDILKLKKDFFAITAIEDMLKVFDNYFPHFIKERVNCKINVKLLTNRSPVALTLAQKDKMEFRQTKFVPEGFFFHTAMFIYGDKLAMISVNKKPVIGIVIEDANIVYTQKMLFEIIWGYESIK